MATSPTTTPLWPHPLVATPLVTHILMATPGSRAPSGHAPQLSCLPHTEPWMATLSADHALEWPRPLLATPSCGHTPDGHAPDGHACQWQAVGPDCLPHQPSVLGMLQRPLGGSSPLLDPGYRVFSMTPFPDGKGVLWGQQPWRALASGHCGTSGLLSQFCSNGR